jgi:acyl-CoA thioester hydrolase
MFNSETGALCTTFEQRVRYVALETCAPLALPGVARKAAEAARVTWDGPAREHRPRPAKLDGFVDTVRDTVKPSEIDVTGQCSLEHHVHRFSAANAQILGALGLTPAYMRDQHRGYSTFEFQFAQTGALRAGASVRVRTGVLHIGNSSIRLLHRMFDAGRGEEVASLEQFGVLLDTDARRPTPLSDDLREKARALLIRS